MIKELSDEQNSCLDALRNFAESEDQIYTVHGLAGTGKTTVLTEFANERDITLVTYTGKASSVLREKSGQDATTIHKLIYIPILDPVTGQLMGFKKMPQNMEGEIIGVDECSMVNEYIARDLRQTGAKIISFGDHGQLPPVEGKPYLNNPDFVLTEIHRQAQNSPIIRQAHSVRNGGQYVNDTSNFQVKKISNNDLLDADIVLCFMNKTRKAMNSQIRSLKGFTKGPKAGESVVCLQNAHKYGLCNGAVYTLNEDFDPAGIGTINIDIDGTSMEVPGVAFANDHEIYFDDVKGRFGKKQLVSAFDFGYCLTVHKSQGSEWKNVMVIDEYFRPDDRIKWVYTAITRAAESIIIERRV